MRIATSARRDRKITIVAAASLIIWIIWWSITANDGRLLFGQRTWVPAFQSIGLDFLHNYLAVRHLAAGGNPYLETFGDPMGIPYNYAPLVLALFAWCALSPLVPAVLTWTAAVAAIMAAAGAFAARMRRMPTIIGIAAILWCTGTIFSMERGNCDALVVLMLMLAVIALRKQTTWRDLAAGVFIALAALIKVYPALAVLGLVALRRNRAAIAAIVAALLISAATPRATMQWLHNVRVDTEHHHVGLITHAHTLAGMLDDIFSAATGKDVTTMRTPAMVVATLLMIPLIVWVSRAIFHSNARDTLAWPYLLWLTQAGTFWSPISYDYKLLFLPLAMLTLWHRRDPWYAHALLLPFLLYWQPLRIDFLPPAVLLAIKFAALIGAALLLVRAAFPSPGTPGEFSTKVRARRG